uniref:Uncharacterized protein n=1 Tax=Arundo donax TaxID=35708 RepID=A0A0A9F9Z4_ARUDO
MVSSELATNLFIVDYLANSGIRGIVDRYVAW